MKFIKAKDIKVGMLIYVDHPRYSGYSVIQRIEKNGDLKFWGCWEKEKVIALKNKKKGRDLGFWSSSDDVYIGNDKCKAYLADEDIQRILE